MRARSPSGPVQAEILLIVIDGDQPALTGPCGPEPWYVEVPQGGDPTAVTTQLLPENVGEPIVLHSTSRCTARGAIAPYLSRVRRPHGGGALARTPIGRAELARGGATSAPAHIAAGPVVEHGLRHLAWLSPDPPSGVR